MQRWLPSLMMSGRDIARVRTVQGAPVCGPHGARLGQPAELGFPWLQGASESECTGHPGGLAPGGPGRSLLWDIHGTLLPGAAFPQGNSRGVPSPRTHTASCPCSGGSTICPVLGAIFLSQRTPFCLQDNFKCQVSDSLVANSGL